MSNWSARLRNREAIVQDWKQPPAVCPRCGGTLEKRQQVFFLAYRTGEGAMVNGDAYFCTACPAVLLKRMHFERAAALGAPGPGEGEYAILGFVDLDAVPEDKRNVPLGEEENPIPLVEFASIQWGEEAPASLSP